MYKYKFYDKKAIGVSAFLTFFAFFFFIKGLNIATDLNHTNLLKAKLWRAEFNVERHFGKLDECYIRYANLAGSKNGYLDYDISLFSHCPYGINQASDKILLIHTKNELFSDTLRIYKMSFYNDNKEIVIKEFNENRLKFEKFLHFLASFVLLCFVILKVKKSKKTIFDI